MNNMIKANVITNWYRKDHANCKFLPFERVLVDKVNKMESKKLRARVGMVGTVIAVSVTPDGKMRGKSPTGYGPRQYTRYYVQFTDGYVGGFHSKYLSKAAK